MDCRKEENVAGPHLTQTDAIDEPARKIRRAFIQTVHAISAVAARRDHYTARHQERVATLALGLGRRLGFPSERLEGLYLGALVHDVGKIAIPSELLSKPGRLTVEEFALMKTHVQVGCEILRFVTLPWPIHSIIAQHHERLDGSGYPKGLSGDAITAEARIVAVADVFQALCDYRPYRKALGIGAALDELERGAGVTFDADAVRALKALAGSPKRHAAGLWERLEADTTESTVILPVFASS